MTALNIPALAESILAGDRRALSRAITLIESTRADHRAAAEHLLEHVLPHCGRSIRLGITGVPGVGKSTFIESFGSHVLSNGHRVAVLAVDPSSPRTGGSILGDKTRMERLGAEANAFIRPSPSGGALGGVARRTREALLLCEAAGFDIILIETVGVGQSETTVAEMVDMFLLLLAPGTGDELQGIKKGIVELADLVIVNKADGDLAQAAERARHDYANALHLLRPASDHWTVQVVKCSATTGDGVGKIWSLIEDYRTNMSDAGAFAQRRAAQAVSWMWHEVRDTLLDQFRTNTAVRQRLAAAEAAVECGQTSPGAAARALLADFLASS